MSNETELGDRNGAGRFTDLRVTKGFFGAPELAALDANRFCVSDRQGVIYGMDIATQKITQSPSLAAMGGALGSTLRSLAVSPNESLVAAATKAAWAGVWNVAHNTLEKVHSEAGTVNSVAFSPDGSRLVLGTGCYPLNPSQHAEARLEVWTHQKEEWRLEIVAALPGVCVDWLAWDKAGTTLVALTGRRSQDGGYVTFLESSSLRALRVVDRKTIPGYLCGIQEWPPAVAVWGDDFQMIHLDGSGDTDRSLASEVNLDGGCLVEDGVFTTSGKLLDSETGEVIDELPPLEGCCHVIARPGGGFAGISSTDVLRVWEIS